MKLKNILATLVFAFGSVACAETLEGNVAITLKVHEQNEEIVVGPNTVVNFRSFTLKNSDLIRLIAAKEGRIFTTKARLIIQSTFSEFGSVELAYLIREQGQADLDITSYLTVTPNPVIQKHKRSTVKKTGSGSIIGLSAVSISFDGTEEGFFLSGPLKGTQRSFPSKEFADVVLQTLVLNVTLAGHSKLKDAQNIRLGYTSGTLKISGMKIVK
jgi:hypothetical protein